MTDQTVNIPLLRKAVEWAEAEAALPEIDRQWDQSEWQRDPHDRATRMLWGTHGDSEEAVIEALAAHCGTAYCIAGYVGAMQDKRFESTWHDGDLGHVETFAARELGLDRDEADRLFSSANTIADVRRIAESLAGEKL